MSENVGTYLLPLQAPSNGAPRKKYTRYIKCTRPTYLGLIAYVIQDSPDKMLTFSQLMDKLVAFVSGDRKGLENNIRVCLSTNDCFVKVPVSPHMPNAKKNFWSVDESQITAKMVRRHFKGVLDQFPELSCKVATEVDRPSERCATANSPTADFTTAQKRCEVKFNSPFSIESLLKRDSPPASHLCPNPSPLVSGGEQQTWCAATDRGVGTKRRLSLDSPPVEMQHPLLRADDSYPIYTTGGDTAHGLIGGGARPVKRMRMCADPPYVIFRTHSAAPHFTSPQNCNVYYPVSTYAYDSRHFRL